MNVAFEYSAQAVQVVLGTSIHINYARKSATRGRNEGIEESMKTIEGAGALRWTARFFEITWGEKINLHDLSQQSSLVVSRLKPYATALGHWVVDTQRQSTMCNRALDAK